MRTNTDQIVVINVADGTFWSGLQPRRYALPPGLSILVTGDGFEWRNPSEAKLTFKAEGQSPNVLVSISDGRGSEVLQIDWLTGAITSRS
jgi:hypothetical protein